MAKTKKQRLNEDFRAGAGTALGDKLDALITSVNDLKAKFTAHLANGSHTAAANQTGANVTASTPTAALTNDLNT